MAATGKTPILLYGSTTPTNAPAAGNLTNSSDGCEIAINVADKNLFFKDSTNAVNTVPIRQSSASSNGWLSSTDWTTFNGKAPAFTYTTNYIPFGQGTTTPTESSLFTYTSGNLLLGTSTNSARLSIGVNSANADGIYALNANNSSYFSLYACGATGYGVTDWANSTLLEAVPASGGNLVLGSYSGSVVIQTGARAKSSRFFASGGVSIGNTTDPGAANLSVSGNVVIATSGKGIDFSATAGTGTSELLADYEEGTFTPTITAASGSITAYTSSGTYTKIGREVIVNVAITITNAGTGAGGLNISLPYTTASTNASAGSGIEVAAVGFGCVSTAGGSAATFSLYKYDFGTPIGTNYGLRATISYIT